jgi:hypothetical protein
MPANIEKTRTYAPHKRTCIYLEASFNPFVYVKELRDLGFDVMYDTGRPQVAETVRMVAADVLIVWVDNATPWAWVKIGYAMASGLRIVAIGSRQLPQGMAALQEPTWDDLAKNKFLALGDGDFKKEK